ncbi:lipopolysaccharide biosynthesis protein [Limosilactobacillus reuteri subsp. suis]|uniref:lipopolysaccharide biosynthesis protein n=1 Tax=Limosilactobacillus reuteri TaxID=1598 RepID=UPI0039932AA7
MIKKFVIKYRSLSISTRASIWYTFANVLVKGIALLSTPIFTRVMTTNEYGTFTIFQSWYNIILIFTSLNIYLSGYTKGLLKFRNSVDEFTSSSLSLVILVTCGWGLIYIINIDFWTDVFQLSPVLMLAMFIELIVAPPFEFWATRSRFNYKYKKYVFASLAMSFMSVILGVITVIYCSRKVEARVYSDVFSRALIGIIILCILFARGKTFYNKKFWLYNLKFNIPLIPHYLSNFLLNQSDRIMISRMVGNTEAAYYGIAYTISTMMNLVIMALNSAFTPLIYKSIDQGKAYKIKGETAPLFILVAFLCILTMAFAPEIITIFAGKNYAQAIYVVPPISASVYFIFIYSMFSTIEYFYQKTIRIAIATTISAIINVTLNLYFIRIFGYYAAGYTTLFSYILLALMHFIFYRLIVKDKLGSNIEVYSLKIINVCSIVVLSSMLLMALTYRILIIRYVLIVLMLIIIFVKGKDIKKIILELRRGD